LVLWVKAKGPGKKGDAPHVNNIELVRHRRWRSNVWTYPSGSDARAGMADHSTVKPRTLLEDTLLHITDCSEIVLEAFAGSGSTLKAADTVGRIRRAIEIDALYCDVMVQHRHPMRDWWPV
jgi:DNA modification methylase